MAKGKGLPLGAFLKRFTSESACQEYLAAQRWKARYVCPKCESLHGYRLGYLSRPAKDNPRSYLDEFCFRFSRRPFGPVLLDRLVLAIAGSVRLN